MYQVFLVDDEALAVEGLRLLVDWQRLGACVCGVAYDGLSAREKILELKPDIVFADIRMPGMNGLDLIASVKKKLPSTAFVVISGYNEFEYVRSALRLGVIDYIDKPVTVEKIEEVYRKIDAVFRSREEFHQRSMSDREQISLAVEELLRYPENIEKYLPQMQKKYRIDFSGLQNFAIAVCTPLAPDAKERIGKLFRASFGEKEIFLSSYWMDEKIILFLSFSSDYNAAGFGTLFRSFCEPLISDGVLENVGLSGIYCGMEELASGFKSAEQALQYAEYSDEPFVAAEELACSLTPPAQMLKGSNNIVYYFHTGDNEKMLIQVREMLDLLLKSDLAQDLFYNECMNLVHIGIGLCRETGKEFDRDGAPFLPYVEIRRYHKAAEIADWVFSVYQSMIRWLDDCKRKGDNRIAVAKDYIDENFSEPITLPFLASLCGMQPTYFSMLFKEQVGLTYVKYINVIRMEHAKKMLAQGMKVKDIYEKVGFQNYRYFCDKFKGSQGYTPEQYRNHLLQGGEK